MRRTGLGSRKPPEPPDFGKGEDIVEPPSSNLGLLLIISIVSLLGIGAIAFLAFNASSIDLICKPLGNCKRFREASEQAGKAIELAQSKFESGKSLADLNSASKLVNDSKNQLSSIDENAKDLPISLAEQRAKVDELDKKIAVSMALEEKADQSLKAAIAKIKQADALNRDPQGAKEDPTKARDRLMQPKTIYIEAQSLLKTIPDKSLVAAERQTNLALATDKIKDLDNKINAIKALDPCVINPDACQPIDPCVANPDACRPTAPVNEPEPYNPPAPAPARPPLFGPGSY